MPEATEQLRPALYYPYIHIRSERWLKATLLCVPSVKRIVPQEYSPEDEPTITRYTTITGPHGTLLQSVPSYTQAADAAQHRLLDILQENATTIDAKYGRTRAPAVDDYWIHKAKFVDTLLDHLLRHQLAWPSVPGHPVGNRMWYALHPTLGKAIMTTLGLSIARDEHYDIVTSDGKYHEALLATKEEAIFETLLRGYSNSETNTLAQTRRELGQMVIILSGVNFDALLPERIPELQASPRFRTFQQLLRASASTFNQDIDDREYRDQLRQEANQIVTAWQETKHDVSKDLREVLFEGVALGAEALKTVIKGPEMLELGIVGGIGLWRVASKVFGLFERRERAHHYLTDVLQAQHPVLKLMYPLGIQPDT